MEESATTTTTNESWVGQLACTLAQQRSRVQEFLAAQRSRLQKAQAELAEQAQRLGERGSEAGDPSAQVQEEIRRRTEDLTRQTENLSRLQEELQSRQAEWDQAQQRATQYLNDLAEQVHREQDELASRREELEQHQARLDAAAAKLHHDQQSLVLEREEHKAQVEHTAAKLRHDQQALAQEREEHNQQVEHVAAKLHRDQQALVLEREEHKAQVEHVAELRRSLEANLATLESLREQYEQLQFQAASLPVAAPVSAPAPAVDQAELDTLRAERDSLAQRLNDTEQRLPALIAQLSEAEEQLERLRKTAEDNPSDDFRRRYEMALEDVRELKVRNQELERQLARARETAGPAAKPAGQRLDWEAEKSRILAALEADFDDNDEQDKQERLKIEEVIRRTDQALEEKDREIQDLKQLLENQSSNLGAVAVGAAALGEVLDKDAIIQEERENLRRLQEEWEGKMRRAEIEISVERAKIARQRAELEAQLHAPDAATGQPQPEEPPSAKPARGRWLNRLGLGGSEKE